MENSEFPRWATETTELAIKIKKRGSNSVVSDTVATARSDAQCCDHFVVCFFLLTTVGGREGVEGSGRVGYSLKWTRGGWDGTGMNVFLFEVRSNVCRRG